MRHFCHPTKEFENPEGTVHPSSHELQQLCPYFFGPASGFTLTIGRSGETAAAFRGDAALLSAKDKLDWALFFFGENEMFFSFCSADDAGDGGACMEETVDVAPSSSWRKGNISMLMLKLNVILGWHLCPIFNCPARIRQTEMNPNQSQRNVVTIQE